MTEEVAKRSKPYRQLRRVLLVVFLISFSSLVVFSLLSFELAGSDPPPPESSTLGVVTLFTSAISLLGWFSTTALAWRKDRREARAADMDFELRRQALEIEERKLRLETDRLEGRDVPKEDQ